MMSTLRFGIVIVAVWAIGLVIPQVGAAVPLGTDFTYQAQLKLDGVPLNGQVDMRFTLYDAAMLGNQVGTTAVFDGQDGNGAPVDVTDGLLTVSPDFGSNVFDGTALWIEIEVRNPHDATNTGLYDPLDPRQPLTPTPVALALRGLRTTQTGDVGFPDAWNIIGGHPANSVAANVAGGTIAGGGSDIQPNLITEIYGSIGGGLGNTAGDFAATVGGGLGNTASGTRSTVSGGSGNSATANMATVSGGINNFAGDSFSTVSGGNSNTAAGSFSTVPGGQSNRAGGDYSFAAGRRAKADHQGAFVWADSTDADFASTGPDQFLIRAAGGVGIGTASPGANLRLDVAGRIAPNVGTSTDATYRFGAGSENTGFSSPAPNEIALITGGSERMRIDSAGNVGIGTATPNGTLSVVGTTILNGVLRVFSPFSGINEVFDTVTFSIRSTGTPPIVLLVRSTSGAFLFEVNENGDVFVPGTLIKGGGAFKIDHPLDPEHKYLYHSFVESPDMMNIYNGNVTTDRGGYATVEMPDWFEALNSDFRYQLTVIGQFAQAIVAEEISDRAFVIRTNRPNVKVSWQVTGIRRDAWANTHRIPVEEDKAEDERGRYLHPKAFGLPPELGMLRRHAAAEAVELEESEQAEAPDNGSVARGE